MDYKVRSSDIAKRLLDDFLFYIYATLGNETAAARVLEDAENTIQKLSKYDYRNSKIIKICRISRHTAKKVCITTLFLCTPFSAK